MYGGQHVDIGVDGDRDDHGRLSGDDPDLCPSKDFLMHSQHLTSQENTMSPSPHFRLVELHNLAAHAHSAAAVAHDKGDHLTGHELSKQAHEHSLNAHKLSQELAATHGDK